MVILFPDTLNQIASVATLVKVAIRAFVRLEFTRCRFGQDLPVALDLRQFTVRRATGRGV